jgi:hypothetical protein
MHIHARIHRWVLWWFYVGIACGAVALVNIFDRDLSRTQDKIILMMGVAHWVLGGLICYACDGITVHERPSEPRRSVELRQEGRSLHESDEWHAASDFVLPGSRKRLLPRR